MTSNPDQERSGDWQCPICFDASVGKNRREVVLEDASGSSAPKTVPCSRCSKIAALPAQEARND